MPKLKALKNPNVSLKSLARFAKAFDGRPLIVDKEVVAFIFKSKDKAQAFAEEAREFGRYIEDARYESIDGAHIVNVFIVWSAKNPVPDDEVGTVVMWLLLFKKYPRYWHMCPQFVLDAMVKEHLVVVNKPEADKNWDQPYTVTSQGDAFLKEHEE